MSGQGSRDEGQGNPAGLVAVLVHRRNQVRINPADHRGYFGWNARVGPKVQPGKTAQRGREPRSRNLAKGLSHRFRLDRRAVGYPGMAAGRRRAPRCRPPIQVGQRRPEHGPVVQTVEGMPAPHAVGGLAVCQGESAQCVLGPCKDVDSHLFRRVQVLGRGQVRMDQGAVAAPNTRTGCRCT